MPFAARSHGYSGVGFVSQLPIRDRRKTGRQLRDPTLELASDLEELLAALVANGRGIKAAHVVEGLRDGVPGLGDHAFRIPMSAAGRLLQDGIDDAEPCEILRCNLEIGCGFLRLCSITPQNRSSTFR